MYPKVGAQDFCDIMDILHFIEQDEYKKEMEEFEIFCQKEKN